ncbi:hypothetical protein [Streptomyces sp. NPDC088915]|uniref:hypothetical protein n=1 Tax=Streptomyces sp. NPDC088915 TaxID=3365912 RepID=UPI003825E7A6
MATTHTAAPPSECGSCVKIHRVLVQHHRKGLGQPLTGAALAAAAGISRRATLLHVAHLVECVWVAADRRTPITGAADAPAPAPAAPAGPTSPLGWATTAGLSCRTCGRLLVILATAASGQWSVQTTESDLAAALDLTGRTVRTHLGALTGRRPHTAPHQITGPLLRTELVPGTAGRGGMKFVFLTGETALGSAAETYSRAEYAELRDRALKVLAQVTITAALPTRERTRAAELLVIPRLHLGYPDAVLVESMSEPGDRAGTAKVTAYGLIKWRLTQRAPLTGYVPAARDAFDPMPVVHDCADCGDPIHAPRHVEYCADCYRRRRAGISLEIVESAEAARLLAMRADLPPAPVL